MVHCMVSVGQMIGCQGIDQIYLKNEIELTRMHFHYQRNDLLLIIHLIWFGKSNK